MDNRDLESAMSEIPLRPPSQDLEGAMNRLWASGAVEFSGPSGRGIRRWQAAVACALCLLIGFALRSVLPAGPRPAPQTREVVYILQAAGPGARNVFDLRGEPAPPLMDPTAIRVTTTPPAVEKPGANGSELDWERPA